MLGYYKAFTQISSRRIQQRVNQKLLSSSASATTPSFPQWIQPSQQNIRSYKRGAAVISSIASINKPLNVFKCSNTSSSPSNSLSLKNRRYCSKRERLTKDIQLEAFVVRLRFRRKGPSKMRLSADLQDFEELPLPEELPPMASLSTKQQVLVGFCYHVGINKYPVNVQLARAHYESAAEHGDIHALNNLSVLEYENALSFINDSAHYITFGKTEKDKTHFEFTDGKVLDFATIYIAGIPSSIRPYDYYPKTLPRLHRVAKQNPVAMVNLAWEALEHVLHDTSDTQYEYAINWSIDQTEMIELRAYQHYIKGNFVRSFLNYFTIVRNALDRLSGTRSQPPSFENHYHLSSDAELSAMNQLGNLQSLVDINSIAPNFHKFWSQALKTWLALTRKTLHPDTLAQLAVTNFEKGTHADFVRAMREATAIGSLNASLSLALLCHCKELESDAKQLLQSYNSETLFKTAAAGLPSPQNRRAADALVLGKGDIVTVASDPSKSLRFSMTPNLELGRKLYLLAGLRGNDEAIAEYGALQMGSFGGKPPNIPVAIAALEYAANRGCGIAHCYLAMAFHDAPGFEHDPVKCLKHATFAAEHGIAPAMHILGNLYFQGTESLEQDSDKAAEWWSKAAQNGNPPSMLAMGLVSLRGIGNSWPMDEPSATMWFEKYVLSTKDQKLDRNGASQLLQLYNKKIWAPNKDGPDPAVVKRLETFQLTAH